MKNWLTFLFLLGITCLSACKVQEEINFKKNLSGSLTYSVDMSMMQMMRTQMQNMQPEPNDSMPNLMPPVDMLGALDSLNSPNIGNVFSTIQGISNAVTKHENGIIKISFDFKDLNALNKAYSMLRSNSFGGVKGFTPGDIPSENSPKETPAHPYFVQKGKEIIFTRPEAKGADNLIGGAMGNMKGMEGTQGMDEMFEYTSKITFEHKVKGIKAKNITATQEPNAVIMKGRMQDMVKPNAELKIRLK